MCGSHWRQTHMIGYFMRTPKSETSPVRCDVLLVGTMGETGPVAAASLESHGLKVVRREFPQNIFRDEWGYRRAVTNALKDWAPSLIMPVGNTVALSRMRDSLPQGVRAAVESEEKVRILDSKVACSALAAELGIPQPRMYKCVDDVGGVQVVFKRDVSFGGHGVHLPWTKDSLIHLIEHQPAGEPYLIEDYIDGTDYSVDAVRWHGGFMASCYRTLSQKGLGPSSTREVVEFPEISAYAERILDRLDYNGVCGMDFRVDMSGKAFFLECNPRFTGGLATQIASGFDIPWLLWNCYLNL